MEENSPDDAFEGILKRCRDKLAEIDLRLPEIDPAPPQPSVDLLDLELPPEPAMKPEPLFSSLPPEGSPEPEQPSPPAAPEHGSEPGPGREEPFGPRASEPPEPAAAERKVSRWAWVALAAVILAASAGYWAIRRGTEGLSLPFENADALGGAAGKGRLMVAAGKSVIILDESGRVVETRPLDAPVAAVAWSGGSLWTADGRAAAFVERRADGKSTSFALDHIPVAVDANDKYLWSVDAKGKMLHQFLVTRSMLGVFLQPLDLYDLPEFTVECFALDAEGVLWLVDSPSRRLYRLKQEGTVYKPLAYASLASVIGDAGRIQGITIVAGSPWLLLAPRAEGGVHLLRRLSRRRLDWTSV